MILAVIGWLVVMGSGCYLLWLSSDIVKSLINAGQDWISYLWLLTCMCLGASILTWGISNTPFSIVMN